MKFSKRSWVGAIVVIASLVIVSSAFAATKYESPAAIVAAITGKTVETVTAERESTGKTYGAIASEAGKLDQFKAENLALKQELIEGRVASDDLTEEEADEIITRITANQESCDGTGDQIMKNAGLGLGKGRGAGRGEGAGSGARRGSGDGSGSENCSGLCMSNE